LCNLLSTPRPVVPGAVVPLCPCSRPPERRVARRSRPTAGPVSPGRVTVPDLTRRGSLPRFLRWAVGQPAPPLLALPGYPVAPAATTQYARAAPDHGYADRHRRTSAARGSRHRAPRVASA